MTENSLVANTGRKFRELKIKARGLRNFVRANETFIEIQHEGHSNFKVFYINALRLRICSPKDDFGYPCAHISGAFISNYLNEAIFISTQIKILALKDLYNLSCHGPVNVLGLISDGIREPVERTRRGGPRVGKTRIRSATEDISIRRNICSICCNSGHNKRARRRGFDE